MTSHILLVYVRWSPQSGAQALAFSLLVDLALRWVTRGQLGIWWGNAIGWFSHSPPHFHILYQHLHTLVMTTHTLPVYTESAIQKACQWDGSSTHSLRGKKLNDLFERERKGACELRGKIKLESVWVLWAAVGGEEVTLALYPFWGVHQSSTPQDWAAGSIPIASHRDNSALGEWLDRLRRQTWNMIRKGHRIHVGAASEGYTALVWMCWYSLWW